jgi:cell division transport system ATP-binding protein
LPYKTAFENVSFTMEVSERSDQDIESDVPYALELVGMSDKADSFPSELSGGEKQRLAIARAIVTHPDVLIADEPTGNLDPGNSYEIMQILKKINNLGTTILLTTHNKGIVDSLGKRVITMERGRIVRDDKQGRYII